MSEAKVEIPAPPPLTQTLVRRILGFGVWVAIGLAPFLGKVRVPGFTALLELYPPSLRWLIPLSGILMGAVALTVEYVGDRHLEESSLDRWFRRGLIVWVASFVLLLALYPFLVTRVEFATAGEPGAWDSASFVTGGLTVPAHPPGYPCECAAGTPADRCIESISFNDVNVRTCFGPTRVAFSNLALAAVYLLLTGSFAAAVGVLVLRQRE